MTTLPRRRLDDFDAVRTAHRPRRSRWPRRIAAALAAAVVAAALPFLVLLRGSTWLYAGGHLSAWAALAAGAGMTVLLLAAYALVASLRLRRRVRVSGRLVRGLAALVIAYVAYGLLFLSGANAKSDAIRDEYRSLHPLLRMATSTLVLADGELLVTDAARTLDDYAAMGLPPNESSLHFEQDDGFAHALDIRTTGRSELRNGLTRAYFAALGFRTLRHTGTADHLHVSLPLP